MIYHSIAMRLSEYEDKRSALEEEGWEVVKIEKSRMPADCAEIYLKKEFVEGVRPKFARGLRG